VNLLLGLHCPIIYQYWHELAERLRYHARRYEKEVRRMLNPRHPTKLPREFEEDSSCCKAAQLTSLRPPQS
jgi:hypothetical protein